MRTGSGDNVDSGHDTALNDVLADRFTEVAELLEAQRADPNRVRAYRRGADTLRDLSEPIDGYHRAHGLAGLVALPAIGETLAGAIVEMLETGRWRWLTRLRAEVDPEAVLSTVAGIGPGLAARIHAELGIEDLEELELAAHDGRLEAMEGVGEKRARGVRESLAGRFQRPRAHAGGRRPPVDELLDVDREYRERAAAGSLALIAPRRFNPTHEAWLPILHTVRGSGSYTALFSNTARAHELGKTDDWVVIYLDDAGGGQWTVVTETAGELVGKRVVRGRELECRGYYR